MLIEGVNGKMETKKEMTEDEILTLLRDIKD